MQYQIGNFREDTTVRPDPSQPGRYHANISANWNIVFVFGGITMATAVRAARASLSQPHFDLLSATATFLSPVVAGPRVLDVVPLRVGKGSEQFVVTMRSGEPDAKSDPNLHVVCTFGPKRSDEARFTDLAFPDVPAPEAVEPPTPPPGMSFPRLPYHASVETRPVLGHLPWVRDWAPGPARWAGWHRLRDSPRMPDGSLDPLAYVPASDMIGPAIRQGQGGSAPLSMAISLEICLHFFAHTDSEWLLQDAHATHAADGYASGQVNLWDERRTLVAQATHLAMLRPIPRKMG